jgi:hypothetical protein
MLIFLLYFLRSGLQSISNDLGVFFKSWCFLVVSVLYLIIYGLLKFGTSGMAYVVDTIFVPLLLFPLLFKLSLSQTKIIAKTIFVCLVLNSFVAIYEYMKGIQVFVYEYEEHWVYFRSTSFLSHPLNNALIASFLAIFIYKFKFINPVIIFLLVALSLFCFGARTATLIFIVLSVFELAKIYRKSYIDNKGFGFKEFLVLKIVVMIGVAVSCYAIFYLNFGQRIFENLTFDGSARSRYDVFNIFSYLSFEEYIFGATPEFFENIMLYIDNAVVENYVIGWFLFYGFAGSFFIIVFFFNFLFSLFLHGNRTEKIAIFSFFAISISNNSLASKTPALLFLLVIYVCSFKEDRNASF